MTKLPLDAFRALLAERMGRRRGVAPWLVPVVLHAVCLALFPGGLSRPASARESAFLPDGPWGRVELVPIQTRLPEAMVPDVPLSVDPWIVGGDRERASRLLADAGVASGLAEQLLSTYDRKGEGRLRPTPELIRALDAEARGRLYEELRLVPGNSSQLSAHKFRRDRLEARFRDLSPDTFELLTQFLYERPGRPASVYLADLPALMRLVGGRGERVRVIQAVSEQESVLLRLRLDDASDAAALADYWGVGGRRRDLEILIGSLIHGPSPGQIDAIYLLPPFARSFLLTYPRIESAGRRDCFWTALNFFLPAPDDGLEGPEIGRVMVERYERVDGRPRLGDMLVLWRPTGEPEHAAIYIAGDVYFTKNGKNVAVPWLFMPLADILERYDEAEPTPLVHYRLKGLD